MRTVGLIGGLGPESTIDYYRRIIAEWQREDPQSSPSIVIDSLDVTRGLWLAQNDLKGMEAYLNESIARLVGAKVDFIALTANTGHLVFDEIAATSPVPMISIVETCADEAERRGLKRLLLLGTRFTQDGPFYPRVFGRRGMEIVTLTPDDRIWLHERYIGELLRGDFRDTAREGIVARVMRAREEHAIDGVILGGTELPLLLQAETIAGLPMLDTTALHVTAIVGQLRL